MNKRVSVFAAIELLVLMLASFHHTMAQSKVPMLERVITITIEGEPLEIVLQKISRQGGFTFSYNPTILEGNRVVSFSFTNKTVREVLDHIFRGTVQYKERSKYIILTRAEISSVKDPRTLSGYVIDEATGERLKNVSVYDPVSLSSAVTDAYGYFQIEIDKPTGEEIKLAVNKRNYTDTLVVVPTEEQRLLNIPIKINTDRITTLADTVGQRLKRFWLSARRATEQAINMENIQDSLYRRIQFSIVPFIGSNGKLSGNVINQYSLNLLGGYSLGVTRLEFGGLFNTVGGDVKGAQFAGLFNAVMGKRRGWQMAGLFNATRDSSSGAQFAGLMNVNLNASEHFAMAGLLNFTRRDSRGVMMAGLGNITLGQQAGPHFAGLYNFSIRDAGPAQVAGLLNFTAGSMRGAQVSGILNFAAKQVRGAQVSGILNVATGDISGAQISGLINVARHVRGMQLGVINIADSVKGVPIGFLSIVGKGYHKIEISSDEIFYTNLAFRTGVRQFYNILTAGVKPNTLEGDETLWTFGYGLGTAPKLSRNLYLNFDLTSNQIVNGNSLEALNLLNKLYIGLDLQLAKSFSVTFGGTLNGHFTETDHTDYPPLFSDYEPHIFHESSYSNDINFKMWWGAKVGLRFL